MGQQPQIEDHVRDVPAGDRLALLSELIAVEVELRTADGQPPHVDSYLARFPDAAEAVRAAFGGTCPSPETTARHLGFSPADNRDADELPVVPGADELPARLGRYELLEKLGRGGFAHVGLYRDTMLDRRVAIKIPRRDRLRSSAEIVLYVREARHAAKLEHRGIVTVYDVQYDHGLPFIVMEYVEGGDLRFYMARERPGWARIVELTIAIADAVGCAHQHHTYHRDLKPSNILVDRDGTPRVADFGLAVHESRQGELRGEQGGTLSYMSPEQIRGLAHRLEGRSDIWGLGVLLYWMLTDQLPFSGAAPAEIRDRILHRDPPPPRQIRREIPAELQRICLKCLEKSHRDRYGSVADLIDDLRHWSEASVSAAPSSEACTEREGRGASMCGVLLKGLHSFDERDQEFFLELLPGTRDRAGLPPAVRFWKTRIEELDSDRTFSVGVMFGPSGCGKTSLLRAGILPRLDRRVLPVYVEATPRDTEVRLLRSIRKHCPQLGRDLDLPQTIAALQSGCWLAPGCKILIVIDQFEQWLHAEERWSDSQLLAGLRHCDGGHVQCVVTVREDFWMSITRFMHALEIPLREEANVAAVDLFSKPHALKVLTLFGQSLGRVAAGPAAEQALFLADAIDELADSSGRIISVRLALVAQMMQHRPWTREGLRAVGGLKGLGLKFLDETMSGPGAPPHHRYHEAAARAILQVLVPDDGVAIKGVMRSRDELLAVCPPRYRERPQEFEELLHLLDRETRLITSTEPDKSGATESQPGGSTGRQFFQLTHDYLVRPVRDWLHRERTRTFRGRLELRMAERAALWNARPEVRQLPSLGEYAAARLLTESKRWTGSQRRMMSRADRFYGLRTAAAAVLLLLVLLVGREWYQWTRTADLVAALPGLETRGVPEQARRIVEYPRYARPRLERQLAAAPANSTEELHLLLALLPLDPGRAERLIERLWSADAREVAVIRTALAPHARRLGDRFWQVLRDGESHQSRRLRAACVLAAFPAPAEQAWNDVALGVAEALVAQPAPAVHEWAVQLDSVRGALRPPTEDMLRRLAAQEAGESAAVALAQFCADEPSRLCEYLDRAAPAQLRVLTAALRRHRDEARRLLEQRLRENAAENATDDERDELAREQANAAMALQDLDAPGRLLTLLGHQPEPRLRTYLIHRLAAHGVDPQRLVRWLAEERDPGARQALVLSLGEYDRNSLRADRRDAYGALLREAFCRDPDAGVHAAIEWVLRTWEVDVSVEKQQLAAAAPRADRDWFITPLGLTMNIVDVPWAEPPSAGNGQQPRTRRIAVSATEITCRQFATLMPDHHMVAAQAAGESPAARSPEQPATDVTWFDAMEFCVRLSTREGLSSASGRFPDSAVLRESARLGTLPDLPDDILALPDYRLPTVAEWRLAGGGGVRTSRSYGHDPALLPAYAWYSANTSEIRPVAGLRPNRCGLWDVLGNVSEWCLDSALPSGPDLTPSNQQLPTTRAACGGNCFSRAEELSLRSAAALTPATSGPTLGFRVVRALGQPPGENQSAGLAETRK